MNVTLLIALITAVVSAAGWVVNHVLTTRREAKNRQRDAYLRYTERQLEELYGPLAVLIAEDTQAFKDLLSSLGRRQVFPRNRPLPPDELRTWLFWVENVFLPSNERVKSLIMTKTHLIEGDGLPGSYLTFLDHCNSWRISHLRWQKEGIEYSWHSRINYPQDFSRDVLESLRTIKSRHAELIAAIGRESRSAAR